MIDFSSVLNITWAQEYYQFLLNILCVVLFLVLSVAVFEFYAV